MTRHRAKGARASLMARTWSIYRHQAERARLSRQALPYSLAELRAKVDVEMAAGSCGYCLGPLTAANLSLDHGRPLARGGGWGLDNLRPCCRVCNEYKGSLLQWEYLELLTALEHFEPAGRADVLRRLRAGAGRWGRK